MSTTLTEKNSGYRQGSRAVVPEGKGALMEVRLMGWEPGSEVVEGSSGDYPISAIERDFAEAFPIGTRMKANHDGLCEAGGDIRRIMAKTIGLPVRKEDGMYAPARAREGEATDFLRQYADVVGTSVSVGVELEKVALTDDEGEPILDDEDNPVMVVKKSERGAPIVKRFLSMSESPYNSVDFVEAPGADGAVVSIALESAKALVEHTSIREAATFTVDMAGEREKDSEATPPRKNKEKKMDEEDVKRISSEAAKVAVAEYVESQKPSASDAPTLSATVEALDEAGLSKAGKKAVLKRVEAGESVTDAITEQKALEDSIKAEFGAKAEASTDPDAETVETFGFTTSENDSKPGETSREALELQSEALALAEMEG